MFTKLAIFSIALIAAAPVLAANSGGVASGGSTASAVPTASAGHAGSSGGGGGGGGTGHGGGSFGAHSAAMSTHLGGAGHMPHGAAPAHSAARVSENRTVAMTNQASKKPGHGPDHASHIFLHRGTSEFQTQWAATCIRTFAPPDGAWADCNRPVKTNSGNRT